MRLTKAATAILSATASIDCGSNPRAPASSKNILLSNDDGWAATNIRATYYKLKDAGYNVYMVAPVSQRSGFGGKLDFPISPTLETDGDFGYPTAGSPSWGHEDSDDHIWYFDAAPASCISFAMSYLPKYYYNESLRFDLVVSGPNHGHNLSPGVFTASGTMGAAYNAVYRGVPGVSFSGANSKHSFYKDDMDLNDNMSPSTIYANKITEIVDELLSGYNSALPIGTGLNVNFPAVGHSNENCIDPTWVKSRISGEHAESYDIAYNETSNSFGYSKSSWAPLEVCENGDCKLPSENFVVEHMNCSTSISVFNIDYDANSYIEQKAHKAIKGLFH